MIDLATHTSQILGVGVDEAIALLRAFQWNTEARTILFSAFFLLYNLFVFILA